MQEGWLWTFNLTLEKVLIKSKCTLSDILLFNQIWWQQRALSIFGNFLISFSDIIHQRILKDYQKILIKIGVLSLNYPYVICFCVCWNEQKYSEVWKSTREGESSFHYVFLDTDVKPH